MSAPTNAQALLDDAKCYADRGLSCVPIFSANGKKAPIVKWGIFAERLPTEAEYRNWFTGSKANGIGIITGAVSGNLAIRDFDRADRYEEWKTKNSTLARVLPTVKTSRGFHVWGRSDLARTIMLDDGEYRGAGISLAPHSEHYTGVRYEWVNPLPKGDLPLVEHAILIGQSVIERAETTEAMASVVSVVSALSITSSVDEILAATTPTRPGERNACIFSLARGLRFHPDVDQTNTANLKALVRQWHTRALPVITSKCFDESWADFIHAFDRVKYPLGTDFIDQAAAGVDPHDLPPAADQYEGEHTRRLIGLCFELARVANKNGNFFISAKVAADRTGVTPMQAWRTLNMLCRDGVLDLVEKGHERRASRYQWRAQSGHADARSEDGA